MSLCYQSWRQKST